jgi:ABC-type molybdate transport system permease subunit
LAIFKRFPTVTQILPVYATIVLVLYSWTILWFLWQYPGWLFFLNIGEILVVLAYSLATNFVESLLLILIPIGLAVVLPKKWFAEAFIARSVTLVAPLLGYLMYLAYQPHTENFDYPNEALNLAPLVLLGTLLLVFFAGKQSPLRKLLEDLADRAIIFTYISIPCSILAILIIITRLILGALHVQI